MFRFFKIKKIQSLTVDQLKKSTKVLIIDDTEPKELRDHLRKEGWKNYYLDDLDALSNKRLEDSQIVCIDIMGVGKKLQVPDGMGLVKHIKDKYPEKKIILYSSVSKQDIFAEALDYVDKRLRKEASLVPFSSAIEEMAAKTFSWDETIKYAYSKIKNVIGEKITFEQFKISAEKSISKKGFDLSKFQKMAGIGFDVASKVSSLISLALKTIE